MDKQIITKKLKKKDIFFVIRLPERALTTNSFEHIIKCKYLHKKHLKGGYLAFAQRFLCVFAF